MIKRKDKNMEKKKSEVPVFFAADENYMPFLGITLASLKKHISKENTYKIYVLYTGKLGKNAELIKEMETENLSICFQDVSENINKIVSLIHCRDYYTSAIYFRLFIPELFPEYDKAVYLDCDTILLADIAELYDIGLGENYIGAVSDQVITSNDTFSDYTRFALGIEPKKYFNSGVIVMNLKKFRELDFCDKFSRLLGSYDFIVAPDQDCLNLICKGKVHYYGMDWNRMPIGGAKNCKPKLVHYNLSMKPWHYAGVLFEKYFWDTAKETPFYAAVLEKKANFTPAMAKKDEQGGINLLALAQAEADSPYNYLRTVGAGNKNVQQEHEVVEYDVIEDFSRKVGSIKSN